MNVTNDGFKDRQLHNEGYLQMVSAEQKEYAEVSTHQRITENNDTITDFQTDRLMEKILQSENLNEAYKKVKSNKGAGGVDGMSVDELLTFLKSHQRQLIQKLKDGTYKPNPVRRVEIPKETKGKFRKLGVPTVVDRVFQQAITQVLTPIFEKQFSENSYGFRPKRGAHTALKQCQQNVDDGYAYVVDMDLEKFFDTVCQSKLIEVLSRTVKNGRVISLIHKYLNAGVINRGVFEKTEVGMPQGGPLSPLLSNIMPYIEDRLFLKVNREKTKVAHISKVKYLGYGFYRYKGMCRLRVHPKSIAKMKAKLKSLTSRNNGWVNYFGLADMKSMLTQTDEWLRRKIRAIYWKQWKKVKTRYRMIQKFGVPEWKVHELANCRKGTWRAAVMLNSVLTNKIIASLGFTPMTDYYLKNCEN